MATQIHFGTSGWRAVMAEEFTFSNVRRAVTGIARYVVSQKTSGARVIVGRDPRFLGETFCAVASEILIAHGITPLLIAEAAPTPAISYAVIQEKADGAINFTASHNPPEYNGIKFSTPDGAPALPEVTKRIEAEIAASDAANNTPKSQTKSATAQTLEPRSAYLARLREIVDLKAIQRANMRVVFDPFWGAARGYSDALLRDAGVDVSTVHDCRDVLFGGHAPEPDDHLLEGCRERMRATKANIGIATDGDADRFGIVDADGTFFTPNYIVALLFDYLVESRGWKNGVAKSVATTNLINAVAKHHGVELYETPVGFKYIGQLILQDAIALGGEESAGLTIRGHVPEKDGILACLLVAEMLAARGASIKEQVAALFKKLGREFWPVRENMHLSDEQKANAVKRVTIDASELLGRKIVSVDRTDGAKFVFEGGSWMLLRLSGTEPLLRLYVEAETLDATTKLTREAKNWVLQG